MDTFSHHTSENDSHRNRREDGNAATVPQEESATPRVLACILLLPKDVGFVMSVLQRLASNDSDQVSVASIPAITSFSEPEDCWLDHSHAAQYLGISKSTLYRYAEHRRIESRKIGRRLEYRHSVLDKFKDQHTRPPLASISAGRYDAVGA
jgi:excisionase family DNA binding protein